MPNTNDTSAPAVAVPKGDGSSFEMTDDEAAVIQAMVDQLDEDAIDRVHEKLTPIQDIIFGVLIVGDGVSLRRAAVVLLAPVVVAGCFIFEQKPICPAHNPNCTNDHDPVIWRPSPFGSGRDGGDGGEAGGDAGRGG